MTPHPPSGPSSPQLTLIVAATLSKGIGLNGGLPWQSLRSDMRYFARVTKRTPRSQTASIEPGRKLTNAVIMGRKTWDSIPTRFRPLPDRLNVVVSRRPSELGQLPEGAIAASSLEEALQVVKGKCILDQEQTSRDSAQGKECVDSSSGSKAPSADSPSTNSTQKNSSAPATVADTEHAINESPKQNGQADGLEKATTKKAEDNSTAAAIDRVFVIGGAEMYKLAAQLPCTRRVLLTEVTTPFECDTFFPLKLSANEGWRKSSRKELENWVGESVPEGVVSENGIEFEFQMFEKAEG